MMRSMYRLLSVWAQIRAALKGPVPWLRNRARAKAHKTLAKLMRRSGL